MLCVRRLCGRKIRGNAGMVELSWREKRGREEEVSNPYPSQARKKRGDALGLPEIPTKRGGKDPVWFQIWRSANGGKEERGK